jgi:hypothetical protein
MNTKNRTEIKDIAPEDKSAKVEDLDESALDFVVGASGGCTCANTCHVGGYDDDTSAN